MTTGHFDSLPNLRVLVDGQPRGVIETRDYDRLDPTGPVGNWWWVTLRRDDGVWVEGSVSQELVADSVEELEAKTRRVIEALLANRTGTLSFEPIPGPIPARELPPDDGPEPEDAETSELFRAVDEVVSAG
ncbi:MAG TPA: hypothetical protein VEI97_18385, partial [bacterium]|nr:hypothetical protein [bacterium]